MYTIRQIRSITLATTTLTAVLAGMVAPVSATVPVIHVQPKAQLHQAKPAIPASLGCAQVALPKATTTTTGIVRQPDTQNTLSARAQAVLQGGDAAALDGVSGDCRLADSSGDSASRLNDGEAAAQLAEKVDEMMQQTHPVLEGDLQAPPNEVKGPHLDISEEDHQVHAYLGEGITRHDLGALRPAETAAEVLAIGERLTLQYDNTDHRYHVALGGHLPSGELSARAQGVTAPSAAVPEPAAYATLLAGLFLLAVLRRRPSRPTTPTPASNIA